MRGWKPAVALFSLMLLVSLAAPGLPVAGASADDPPSLPPGWTVEARAEELVLVYQPAALPVHDARPEFRDAGDLLGYPREVAGRLELALSRADLLSLESPSAWLSGRRLDGPTPSTAIPRATGGDMTLATRTIMGAGDPGVPGPYTTRVVSYQQDDLSVAGFDVPVEVLAEVTLPEGATGPRPLVLILHGRHASCYGTEPEPSTTLDWPCPEGMLPIPSYQGYRYMANLLGTQGYVVVSISANGINGQDGWAADAGASARSALIRHHLHLWTQWAARQRYPWQAVSSLRVDLQKVVLVGHSRGGEGVERAAVDSTSADGYRIVGLADIAPTAFGRQVAAGITRAVILPYCDGDVIDLQGQAYVDDGRDLTADDSLRSAVMVLGANHNFFNTEWTPGLAVAPADDDWSWAPAGDDPACSPDEPARLTPAEQQAVGATYVAALVKAAVSRDARAVTLLDGTRVRAASTGTARVLTHALGARRTLVYKPALRDLFITSGFSVRVCRGYAAVADPNQHSDCAPASAERLPHWLPMMGAGSAPSPLAVDLQWWRAGGTARLVLPHSRDLTGANSLDLRVAVEPGSAAADLRLRLIDSAGAVALLPAAARLAPLPGNQVPLGKIWAQTLRFDLAGAADDVDLTAIKAIELMPHSPRGRAWLLDIYARSPGLPPFSPITLPQAEVDDVEILEGGPGTHTVRVPVTIRGPVSRTAALWVTVTDPDGKSGGFQLTLAPGATAASIPITVEGNDVFDLGMRQYYITLKALTQVTTGRYTAAVTVVDDDPAPTLVIGPSVDRVVEGDSLVFTATLSDPIGVDLWYSATLGEVPGRPTLFTDDVTEAFILEYAGWVPDPPQALWQTVYLSFHIPAGETVGRLEIPTVVDRVREERELISITVEAWEDPLLPTPVVLRGIVSDG